jgi:SAM-dependent methyltransferase
MILPQLLLRFAQHRDDAVFYAMQATDSIRWLEAKGLRLGAGVRVLDLGCGHGVFGGQLRRLGCEVTFADEANYLLPEHRDSVWKAVDLDRDTLEGLGRYDLVVFSNVLEHLRHPREFLARADRLLTPGGRLYLSWTNWLSPWGGHEFSPLHYLGLRLGPALYDRIARRQRFHRPGDNLFITHIGRTLGWLEEDGRLVVEAMAPRYYTEWEGLVKVPVVREFLTWNCALLLGLGKGDGEGSER